MKKLLNFVMMKNVLEKDLAIAQEQWEEDSKNNRIRVTEDNVADVVSMMTGIPVNRIAQTESNKLAHLPELIERQSNWSR
jgi:ATP-dependent Clp protease ATP-binding subunit ClpC